VSVESIAFILYFCRVRSSSSDIPVVCSFDVRLDYEVDVHPFCSISLVGHSR
jgi:hypothetical protein